MHLFVQLVLQNERDHLYEESFHLVIVGATLS
jgi:hypothetical protein